MKWIGWEGSAGLVLDEVLEVVDAEFLDVLKLVDCVVGEAEYELEALA